MSGLSVGQSMLQRRGSRHVPIALAADAMLDPVCPNLAAPTCFSTSQNTSLRPARLRAGSRWGAYEPPRSAGCRGRTACGPSPHCLRPCTQGRVCGLAPMPEHRRAAAAKRRPAHRSPGGCPPAALLAHPSTRGLLGASTPLQECGKSLRIPIEQTHSGLRPTRSAHRPR